MASEKEQFLQVWETESVTTRKLAAIPGAKRDFRPHEKARSARELVPLQLNPPHHPKLPLRGTEGL